MVVRVFDSELRTRIQSLEEVRKALKAWCKGEWLMRKGGRHAKVVGNYRAEGRNVGR